MTRPEKTGPRPAGGTPTKSSSRNGLGGTGPGAPGARRRRVWILVAVAVVAIAGVVVGLLATSSSPTSTGPGRPSGPSGPEGIPLEAGTPLAPPGPAVGQTVDGVQCNSSEQVAYHVHTHLSVYVNGRLRPVPAGIGIVTPIAQPTANGPFDSATRCYYWLHVHAQDGVIHIESPVQQGYTLGQFFDQWGQPLRPDQVGPATGPVTVFVNGRPYTGNPRDIPLGSHVDIQIDVGSPTVPPAPVDWTVTSL